MTKDTIEYSVWVKKGIMMVRRDCLDADDPDHLYHYLKRKHGVNPEDYGIENPLTDQEVLNIYNMRKIIEKEIYG